MLTIYYHGKKYGPVPDAYNELSPDQFIRITSLLQSNMKEDAAMLAALRIVWSMNIFRFMLLDKYLKVRMLEYIGWVFDNNSITKQLIPFYDDMFGPADDFDNLTMGEWNACEIFYSQFIEDKRDDPLNCLVAVLYRKPKRRYNLLLNTDGDVRVKFNANEIDYWKKRVAKWKPEVKMAILNWFDGCRENLKNSYDLFDGSGDKGDHEPGMFEVIRGLCGKRYGSIKEVEDMNVHLALRELELVKREAKEMEAASKT